MSILHISPDKKWTYRNESVVNLCARLATSAIDTTVVTRSKTTKEHIENKGIKTHSLPLNGFSKTLSTLSIARLVKTGGFTINTYSINDAVIACVAGQLNKGITNTTVLHLAELPEAFSFPELDTLSRVDSIVLQSDMALKKFITLAPQVASDKLSVDLRTRTYTSSAKKPNDKFIILFYNDLTAENGLINAIDAMALLSDLPVELHIPGTADSTKIMPIVRHARYTANASRIKWLGDVDDLGTTLAAAHLAVIPTIYPMMATDRINDCISSGTHVITTNNGAQPEVLTSTALGTLIDPNSPQAIADAIRRFYTATHS